MLECSSEFETVDAMVAVKQRTASKKGPTMECLTLRPSVMRSAVLGWGFVKADRTAGAM